MTDNILDSKYKYTNKLYRIIRINRYIDNFIVSLVIIIIRHT